MIKVRMGEQHEVEIADIEIQSAAILARGIARTLEQSAVNQKTRRSGFYQIAGTCDLAGGTKKSQFHV